MAGPVVQVTLEQALTMIGDAVLLGEYAEARAVLDEVIASLQVESLTMRAELCLIPLT